MPSSSNYERPLNPNSFLMDLQIVIKDGSDLPERISMPVEIKEWLEGMNITGYLLEWHRTEPFGSGHRAAHYWDTALVFDKAADAARFKLSWPVANQRIVSKGLSGLEFSSTC